jgi:cob(I)alamin adenosyltransferase
MKSNVYTLTGDSGTTSLVGGKRVKKTDIRIEAYGTVDELSSFIGLLHSAMASDSKNEICDFLLSVQNKLFNMGAYLATDNPEGKQTSANGLCDADIKAIENAIDTIDAQLPALRNFVLPAGCRASALAHVCRTVTRRCERRVLALAGTTYIDPVILKYLNRLSDYFFVLARFNNISVQIEEFFWKK